MGWGRLGLCTQPYGSFFPWPPTEVCRVQSAETYLDRERGRAWKKEPPLDIEHLIQLKCENEKERDECI